MFTVLTASRYFWTLLAKNTIKHLNLYYGKIVYPIFQTHNEQHTLRCHNYATV